MAPKKEKTPDKIDGVITEMKAVTEAVNTLVNLMKENLDKMNHPVVAANSGSLLAAAVAPVATHNASSPQGGFPIPYDYLEAMNTILNKKFVMEIVHQPDAAAFELHVLVPREYSNAPAPHWDLYHEDRRTKVIENAFGVNGVREYMNLIYDNFSNETKARVTMDRQTTF